jgi:protein KTI12
MLMVMYSFDNLIQRFEEPSSMVRWDSPLFSFAWDDKEIPLEELWLAATKGNIKAPTGAVVAVSFVQ